MRGRRALARCNRGVCIIASGDRGRSSAADRCRVSEHGRARLQRGPAPRDRWAILRRRELRRRSPRSIRSVSTSTEFEHLAPVHISYRGARIRASSVDTRRSIAVAPDCRSRRHQPLSRSLRTLRRRGDVVHSSSAPSRARREEAWLAARGTPRADRLTFTAQLSLCSWSSSPCCGSVRVQLPGSSTRRCASAASSMSSPRPGAVGRWKRPSTGRGGFEKTACMRGDGSFNSQGLVA